MLEVNSAGLIIITLWWNKVEVNLSPYSIGKYKMECVVRVEVICDWADICKSNVDFTDNQQV